MQIIALIPAAGKGRRFGMPKVDADFNGVSFSQRIMNTLQESGVPNCYVIRDIDTPDMLASLRLGIHRVLMTGNKPEGWLIWPVDHPMVKPETVRLLVRAFTEKNNSIIIPRHNNKNGHPIIIPAILSIPEIPLRNGLKEVIMLSHLPVHHIEVDDPGILVNINTPEDVNYV